MINRSVLISFGAWVPNDLSAKEVIIMRYYCSVVMPLSLLVEHSRCIVMLCRSKHTLCYPEVQDMSMGFVTVPTLGNRPAKSSDKEEDLPLLGSFS